MISFVASLLNTGITDLGDNRLEVRFLSVWALLMDTVEKCLKSKILLNPLMDRGCASSGRQRNSGISENGTREVVDND